MKITAKNVNNTYVIGDVHGCFYTLAKLVKKFPLDAEIILVGDLCDRGLHTREVINFVMENDYHCLLGNHDDYMISHLQECMENPGLKVRWNAKEYMGGEQTLDSYGDDFKTMQRHLEWLKSIPRYIEIDKYYITHGFGLPYYQRRDKSSSRTGLLKNRISDEPEWGHDWEIDWHKYTVVNIFGHTDYEEVEIGENYYGIDTGCVYGKKLTAIQLGSMNLFQEQVDLRDIAYEF